ncbi:MAG: tRNA methyl transferase PRC-barrel domain-containing protein, partial [Rikenellaceae bacterium]
MSEQNKRVVLAYSGGIDSTEAINKLKEQGYEIIALFFSMLEHSDISIDTIKESAEGLGATFDIYDIKDRFQREIIDNFTSEYIAGRTPAPCTRCNPLIKWYALNEYSKRHNIDKIATGHYFDITTYNNKLYVTKPRDARKDQSYYLWGLSQEILSKALTPMSQLIKEDIKQNNPSKKESMGVCFLKGLHYSDYITATCGAQQHGDIVKQSGEVVGQHVGIANYTVGQRRGEGIPAGQYITHIDATQNTITVAPRTELYQTKLYVNSCNVVDEEILLGCEEITIMVRGFGVNPEGYAHFAPHRDGYLITLDSPAYACALGQP